MASDAWGIVKALVPADVIDVIDLRTDLFVYDFPRPELPLSGVSTKDGWATGNRGQCWNTP
jgi:hypothetical protein